MVALQDDLLCSHRRPCLATAIWQPSQHVLLQARNRSPRYGCAASRSLMWSSFSSSSQSNNLTIFKRSYNKTHSFNPHGALPLAICTIDTMLGRLQRLWMPSRLFPMPIVCCGASVSKFRSFEDGTEAQWKHFCCSVRLFYW